MIPKSTHSTSTSTSTSIKRLADLSEGRRDTFMMDPRKIKIDKDHNPRDFRLPENQAHIEFLKASIRQNGVQVPLEVRFDLDTKDAILVDGECRLKASLALVGEGLEIFVPVLQVKGKDSAERLLQSLTANTGKPLSQWEMGNAFTRLVNYGWDHPRISERLGYSVRFIESAIELSEAPEEVREMLSNQEITPALAVKEIRKQGPAEATKVLKKRVATAKASGKKTAKRDRDGVPKTVTSVITSLIKGVEGDIFDSEFKFVEVERKMLVKLAGLVGIKG